MPFGFNIIYVAALYLDLDLRLGSMSFLLGFYLYSTGRDHDTLWPGGHVLEECHPGGRHLQDAVHVSPVDRRLHQLLASFSVLPYKEGHFEA